MIRREVYLDNNATTKVLPEVAEAITAAMLGLCGNPSSVHSSAARARASLWLARERVAALVSADPSHVVFTSGASEANNLVLQSLRRGAMAGFRLVTTAVEHSSVLAVSEVLGRLGQEVLVLPVNERGLVSVEDLSRAIDPGRTLVSIQWANNETGVIQPLPELAKCAQENGAVFHTDAVQAVGKIPVDFGAVPVDLLSLSGHKLHGPLGVGALVVLDPTLLQPLLFGGDQEGSLRPGTENVPGLIGLGVACLHRRRRFNAVASATRRMRDAFEDHLARRGFLLAVNGVGARRLPGTSNVLFREIDGEALVLQLDRAGIQCSQSSACTSRRPEPSYVLRAMGLSEPEAFSSVRFSFSEMNTMADVVDAVEAISAVHTRLRRLVVA